MLKKKTTKKDNVEKLQDEVKLDAGSEVEAADENEVISKKKVIYIEIDDEVGAVYDKIRSVKGNHVYIVVPQKAVIFQSIVNLKILKRKSKEESKTIYFITNDKNGVYLAQQVGITIYDKTNLDGKPSLFSTDITDDKLRITPIRAAINSVEEDAPTRLTERKLSISEILRKKRGRKDMDISKVSPAKKKSNKKKSPRFVIVAPNRHALIALAVFSIFILLTIIYIALPGVTIYLTPTASVLEESVNITLADFQRNKTELDTNPKHMIASYPVEVSIEKTITHYSTGKKFSDKNTNASGYITIINTTNIEWPLIPTTRFQTDDGLIFRIADYADVPRATNEGGPGKLEVYVTADNVDIYGEAIGERGNIPPTTFILPGLKESSQSKLYAENYEPMTGGVTDFVTYVSAEDTEAAKARMRDTLIQSASEELKKLVAEKDELVGPEVTYILLEGENAIKIGEPYVKILPDLEGKEISEFNVSGTVHVSGVYYDKNEMLNILLDKLTLKKSPQKELIKVNEESISYKIFEEDPARSKIKLTANIKGIEQYEIDESKENGARLLDKIRDHIIGKNIEEAVTYIQNLPGINKVEIESWPAWSPTIPNIPDNIEFEVLPALTVE